jgi:hypothetical protein
MRRNGHFALLRVVAEHGVFVQAFLDEDALDSPLQRSGIKTLLGVQDVFAPAEPHRPAHRAEDVF